MHSSLPATALGLLFALTAFAQHPPQGMSRTLSLAEDTPYTFSADDFGFSDPLDTPPNAFVAVRVGSLPVVGSLTADGVPVKAGDVISLQRVHGVWFPREQPRLWSKLALSADGRRLAAVASDDRIHLSPDSGATWSPPREASRRWSSIASSADGQTLVASVSFGQLHVSSDGGVTWAARGPTADWLRVVSSADGSVLAALENQGRIHFSFDSGQSWQPRSETLPWHGLAMSADGTRLVATTSFQEPVRVSSDAGLTWTLRGPHLFWKSALAGSADGRLLFAGAPISLVQSDDFGETWTERTGLPFEVPVSLASSADGSVLAVGSFGGLFTSYDGGATWSRRAGSGSLETAWGDVVSSADGSVLAALESSPAGGLQIHTSVAASPRLTYTPPANAFGASLASFTFQVVDDGAAGAQTDPQPRTLTLDVTPVRDGPVAGAPPPAQTALPNVPYQFQVPAATFIHPDTGASLSYAASSADGAALPSWLAFSTSTRTFSGTPAATDTGNHDIQITATDNGVPALSASSVFRLTVPNAPPLGTSQAATILEDTPLPLPAGVFGFSDAADTPPNAFVRVKLASLPTAGTLTVDGVPAGVGDAVPVVPDIRWAWTPRDSNRAWSTLASSADGQQLAATVRYAPIRFSSDGGATWAPRGPSRVWQDIACSTDGRHLIASAKDGPLAVSADVGATWTDRLHPSDWRGVASSADGTRLFAGEWGGWLWASSNGGATWDMRAGPGRWRSVACSADGQRVMAAGEDGYIAVSSDFGATWSERAERADWSRIRCAADGRRAVAIATGGRLYGSDDGGTSWSQWHPGPSWIDAVLSADGSRLAAVQNPGRIALSGDGGRTWSFRESSRTWSCVAGSADGWRLVAGVDTGRLFTSSIGVPELAYAPAANGSGSPYASFTFQVEDDGIGGSTIDPAPKSFVINVLPSPDPPALAIPIADRTATENTPFSFQIPSDRFVDPDPLSVLSYAMADANGDPLPSWLAYNPATRTLTGTPGMRDVGFVDVRVTATDNDSPPLSASTVFLLRVAGVDQPPEGKSSVIRLETDESWRFSPSDFGFSDPKDHPPHQFTRIGLSIMPAAGMLTIDGAPPPAFLPQAVIQTVAGGVEWTRASDARSWKGIASSADGRRLVAVADGSRIQMSIDAGATWKAGEDARSWSAVASSADGQRLVAAVKDGQVYTSDTAGTSWTARETPRPWTAVACSADGRILAAAAAPGPVMVSTDGGLTWHTDGESRNHSAIALSADGSIVIAAVNSGRLYVSADGGITWSPRESARTWSAVATSADGRRVWAAVRGGGLYASSDSGATWRQCEVTRAWTALAASADGTRLIAGVHNGPLYLSQDSGLSWKPRAPKNQIGQVSWSTVALSADGTRLAAAPFNREIWTSAPIPAQSFVFTPAPGATGSPYAQFNFLVYDDGADLANSAFERQTITFQVVPPAQTPFSLWARARSLPTDPNAAGGRHLLAFAFGLPPGNETGGAISVEQNTIAARGGPAIEATLTPAGVAWRLVFGRRKDAGLTYRVQATADLAQWHEVPVVPEILADDGEIEAVRLALPAVLPDESEPSFARLTVTTE